MRRDRPTNLPDLSAQAGLRAADRPLHDRSPRSRSLASRVITSINAQHGPRRDHGHQGRPRRRRSGRSAGPGSLQRRRGARGACATLATAAGRAGASRRAGLDPAKGVAFNYWVAAGARSDRDRLAGHRRRTSLAPRPCDRALGCRQPAVPRLRGDRATTRSRWRPNGDITADTATNGDVTLGNGASTFLCGNVQVGVGHDILQAGNNAQLRRAGAQGEFVLPRVNQADVRTNNSNKKFFALESGERQEARRLLERRDGRGAAEPLLRLA